MNPQDFFTCETYHCKLSARACVQRQAMAAAPYGQSNSKVARHLSGDLGCKDCDQGKAIKEKYGEGEEHMSNTKTAEAEDYIRKYCADHEISYDNLMNSLRRGEVFVQARATLVDHLRHSLRLKCSEIADLMQISNASVYNALARFKRTNAPAPATQMAKAPPVKNPLSARIKKIRNDNDITQDDFAESLGIRPIHVAMMETGGAKPSKQLIKLICKIYEIHEEWLLEGEGPMTWHEDLEETVAEPETGAPEPVESHSTQSSWPRGLKPVESLKVERVERQEHQVILDFSLLPMLMKDIATIAREEYRTPENQILYWLRNNVRGSRCEPEA